MIVGLSLTVFWPNEKAQTYSQTEQFTLLQSGRANNKKYVKNILVSVTNISEKNVNDLLSRYAISLFICCHQTQPK